MYIYVRTYTEMERDTFGKDVEVVRSCPNHLGFHMFSPCLPRLATDQLIKGLDQDLVVLPEFHDELSLFCFHGGVVVQTCRAHKTWTFPTIFAIESRCLLFPASSAYFVFQRSVD